MTDLSTELTERFERYCTTKDASLPDDVMQELQFMLRLYSISPEELDFKWQAYHMKMGGEETKLDVKTARDFKKNVQDTLERDSRGKAQARNETKRSAPTPSAGRGAGDVFDMYVMMVLWLIERMTKQIRGWTDWYQTRRVQLHSIAPMAAP